jgi:hypothetical protein
MTTATAVQIALSKDAKAADMAKLIDTLVQGAGDDKSDDEGDSEYSEDWSWGNEETEEIADVRRGDDS